jgi:Cft2 family RNA processing exonuclease
LSNRLRIHRLGRRLNDSDIEPSCTVADVMGGKGEILNRLVIDCGLMPKREVDSMGKAWHAPDLSLFEDGRPIDVFYATHIHTDHVGFAPALMPYMGKDAPVIMTVPSWNSLMHGYEDGLKVNAKRDSAQAYTLAQVHELFDRRRDIRRPGVYPLGSGIEMYVNPEGHINGACSFSFKIGGRIIHASGDRCQHGQPGIAGACQLPKAWQPNAIIVSDCTYGTDPTSDLRTYDGEMGRLYDLVFDTLDRGKTAMVLGFAINRCGAVQHELSRRGIKGGYLDGGGRYYCTQQIKTANRWCSGDSPIDLRGVKYVDWKTREVLASKGGVLVTTTSGMGGPGGPSTTWRRHVLPDKDATCIFTGYVAPDSDGAKILAAAAERDRTGKDVSVTFDEIDEDDTRHKRTLPIRCRVEQVRIGSHDSRGGILKWFRDLRPETAILTHGSKEALASLEGDLRGDIPHLVRSDLTPTVEI